MSNTVKQDLTTVASDLEYALSNHDWNLIQEIYEYVNKYADAIPRKLFMVEKTDYEDFISWRETKKSLVNAWKK